MVFNVIEVDPLFPPGAPLKQHFELSAVENMMRVRDAKSLSFAAGKRCSW
jgi:hypothetical protein